MKKNNVALRISPSLLDGARRLAKAEGPSDGSIDQQLRFAIGNKRLIEIRYGTSVRVVEPHDYGVLKGVTRLLAYQRRGIGTSARNTATGWRLLDVPKITACVVLDEAFAGSRSQPNQRHYAWKLVHARVS